MHRAGLLDRTPESEGGIKSGVKVRPAINKDDRDNVHLRKYYKGDKQRQKESMHYRLKSVHL